jgi:hypothetical protein
MEDWYYAPWQYELRKQLGLTKARPTLRLTRSLRIPDPITTTVLAGAVFLAYAPLLQPGPPAKTPTPGTLQIYQLGGGMIV